MKPALRQRQTLLCLIGAFLATSLCSAQTPFITASGIVSASAFGGFSTIAPGSWIEIYGSNLAFDSRSWAGIDFSGVNAPTSLDGTKVTIGGQFAFIDYISPGQVNAQVPSNVASGSQQLIVTTASGSSTPYPITVNATQPGLLAPSSFNVGGVQYAAALFSDSVTFVLPPGAIAGVTSRRAQPGDTITLYGIGFGPVVPSIPAGQVVGQSNTLASTLQVKFGGTLAVTTYDGLAPSAVGLYQINVVVPTIPGSDSVPLTFTLGGSAGTQTLYLAVQTSTPTPKLQSLTLSANSVASGGTVQGTVTLSAAAPIGGAAVALSSNSSAATVPATVTVPAGAISATFTITASASSTQSVTVSAAYSGSSAQAALTVTASAPQKFKGAFTMTFLAAGETSTLGAIYADSTQPFAEASAGFAAPGDFRAPGPLQTFDATFNNVSLVGQTLTLSQPILGTLVDLNFQNAFVSGGSLTLSLSSPDPTGKGTTTGVFTLTTPSGTVSGTASGSYQCVTDMGGNAIPCSN